MDSADSQPCCGTNGVTQWELKATGRLFHSGLPHKGINSIELANEALAEIQRNFYKDFAPCPEQRSYGFAAGSSMKPTQITCSEGGLNQIPPWCKISGDIRLIPFYDMLECMDRIEGRSDVGVHGRSGLHSMVSGRSMNCRGRRLSRAEGA